jgi:DNA-binding MarR family transcriptional regulator
MNKQVDTVNQLHPSHADDVLELMHGVLHQLRARHARSSVDADLGIGHMELKALGFFAHHPGATQSDLVNHSRRDKGQLARLIAGLKERGLLEAKPDEQDRRVIRLYPTEQAQSLHAQLLQQRRGLANQALAGLSLDQTGQLMAWLQHISANLQALDR